MGRYTQTLYIVSRGKMLRSYSGSWWSSIYKKGAGWSNYLVCKSLQNALAQYRRLPVKFRQIDVRTKGKKPVVLKYGKG